MKKIISILLFGLVLSSCSGGLPNLSNLPSLLATPTAPLVADTSTPQPTVTQIPTLDFFAIATSTPITFTPTSTSLIPDLPTGTPVPLPRFVSPVDDPNGNSFFRETKGFRGILTSNGILFWNEGPCTPRNIKISAFVEDTVNTDRVFLFLRLIEKKNTLNVGEWSAGAEMIKAENGSYNYEITTRNLRRYYFYTEAWIEYQLVAVTKDMLETGRTQVYDRSLSLIMCHPVP